MDIFSEQEISTLAQTVGQLRGNAHQECVALEIMNFVSMKMRECFHTPSKAINHFMQLWGHGDDGYLAKVLGSRSRASEILSDKRNLTLSDLRALRNNIGLPADLLLEDPKYADQYRIKFTSYPVIDMVKIGLLPKGITKRSKNLEEEIRTFFARSKSSPEEAIQACYRRTTRKNERSNPLALQAWIAAVRISAFEIATPQFRQLTDNDLKDLAQLSKYADGPLRAINYLHDKGIRVVIMPHLKGTYLDGAIFMLEGMPVIGMTLRYDRLDNFWHTLMHELSHLVLGHVSEKPVFDDLEIAVYEGQEFEADFFAKNILIEQELWDEFVSHRVNAIAICTLAAHLSLSPAIVAGRYRFEKRNYKLFSALVGSGEVRRLFPQFKED